MITPTVTRSFGIADQNSSDTLISVHELSDGTMQIQISTKRPGAEPLITAMFLTPPVFALLHSAMFRAAHDPTVWRSPEKEST